MKANKFLLWVWRGPSPLIWRSFVPLHRRQVLRCGWQRIQVVSVCEAAMLPGELLLPGLCFLRWLRICFFVCRLARCFRLRWDPSFTGGTEVGLSIGRPDCRCSSPEDFVQFHLGRLPDMVTRRRRWR